MRVVGPVVGLTLFVLAVAVLHRELHAYRASDIATEFRSIPTRRVLAAICTAVGSYVAVTLYDVLAMRSVGRRLRYRAIALTSFVAATFSNNLGFGLLTGGSVRFRLYSAWDVSVEEIARVMVFFAVTLWLGFGILAGVVFTVESGTLPQGLLSNVGGTLTLGIVLLLLVAAYVVITVAVRRPIRVFGVEIAPPAPRFLPAQLLTSLFDWGLAGATLFVLMPAGLGLTFGQFLGYYMLALTVGMVSQVPGGVGVFESLMLILLKGRVDAAQLVGILLAYRTVYYLLPLMAGTTLMALREMQLRRKGVLAAAEQFRRWSALITPPLMSFAVFVAGVVLLVSGATPPAWNRFHALAGLLPFALLEGSHFLGSVAGMALIVLARGIQRRVDAAYVTTIVLLTAGIVFSLLKGWDYEEAIVLAIVLVLLLPARGHFSRTSVLFTHRFSPGWSAAIVAVVIGTIWLTVFSHSHVEYRGELWWQFEIDRSAPRSMRALVGALAVLIGSGITTLYRPQPRRGAPQSADIDWDAVERIVRASPNTLSNLVFLGDKHVLFGPDGDSFLMYGVAGRTYVAMGDPIGAEEDWKPLAWKFREMADRDGANAAFYEVQTETLPLYLDMGLSVLKFGEEARVPLESFTLEGPARRGLRYTVNKLTREGCEFAVVSGDALTAHLPELRRVSEDWLANKHAREKAFSLGSFSETYLSHFPVGLVRRDGRIVAFANLWRSDQTHEVSIDLMRHVDDAPQGVMDYLFVQLFLWAQERGIAWFNLGMAPLAGLDEHPMAPMWNRAGAFLFRHGEHFYNFQGLRTYKQKFDPVWRPKYIATPGGLAVASVLTALGTLSSGSVAGLVTNV